MKRGLFVMMCSLAGCRSGVLQPAGPVGVAEARLIVETFAAMLIVVIPVFVMTGLFAWRYRAAATNSNYAPTWSSSRIVESFIWSVPIAVIVFLGIIEWRSTRRLDPFQPLSSHVPALHVDVVAMDWKWLFIYPEQHIATVNELEIPIGTQIAFNITSDSVMNVFFIPRLGTQIYAMAGMQSQLHLLAKNVGNFTGISANFSGPGFPDMAFTTHAVPVAEFRAWVARVQASPTSLNLVEFQKLRRPTQRNKVAYFSSVDPALFSKVLNEYAAVRIPAFSAMPAAKEQ
jgi:cytochrome o ubiquinol oxidase subunit 2